MTAYPRTILSLSLAFAAILSFPRAQADVVISGLLSGGYTDDLGGPGETFISYAVVEFFTEQSISASSMQSYSLAVYQTTAPDTAERIATLNFSSVSVPAESFFYAVGTMDYVNEVNPAAVVVNQQLEDYGGALSGPFGHTGIFAYRLVRGLGSGEQVIDQFGRFPDNSSLSGSHDWDYLDQWVIRNNFIRANGGVFDSENWTYTAVDTFNETSPAYYVENNRFQTYMIPEPSGLLLLGVALLLRRVRLALKS